MENVLISKRIPRNTDIPLRTPDIEYIAIQTLKFHIHTILRKLLNENVLHLTANMTKLLSYTPAELQTFNDQIPNNYSIRYDQHKHIFYHRKSLIGSCRQRKLNPRKILRKTTILHYQRIRQKHISHIPSISRFESSIWRQIDQREVNDVSHQ